MYRQHSAIAARVIGMSPTVYIRNSRILIEYTHVTDYILERLV